MKIRQSIWTADEGWTERRSDRGFGSADWVLVFGARYALARPDRLAEIRAQHPEALLSGCSTAGEIVDTEVREESLIVTAVDFADTRLAATECVATEALSTFALARRLAEGLDPDGLVHVFVLSNGLRVNGSELVSGLANHLPEHVVVTGGLAGDGDRFEETLVLGQAGVRDDLVVAIGLYGRSLEVGTGSLGGWDAFGPKRRVTRAKANVLYELDGKPALELYKRYLGEHAQGLPATGLLFPLSLVGAGSERAVVRTILGVDERDGSMTFAGDVPEGSTVRLMKANFDRLIDGAAGAARCAGEGLDASGSELAILISCVGRRLVLDQRVEEEIEAVRDVLGDGPAICGFYSYGELSPFASGARCELHNQTMTITILRER
ncbi:MAG: FIST C-terminal domain-containing protein [Myxococcales bacterium]|nr:FIST C-terminal domain-containing protein [Myxococcales bacterium]